jgi:hypothetical protein
MISIKRGRMGISLLGRKVSLYEINWRWRNSFVSSLGALMIWSVISETNFQQRKKRGKITSYIKRDIKAHMIKAKPWFITMHGSSLNQYHSINPLLFCFVLVWKLLINKIARAQWSKLWSQQDRCCGFLAVNSRARGRIRSSILKE